MDIVYLGHSSFRINSSAASVVTDPFDKQMVGFSFPKVNATIVTISHDHGDHNKDDNVSGVKKVINGPGEYEVEGVSILGFATYHDDSKGKERGRNTIYLIEMDGFKIAHLGDLGHKLDENTLTSLGEVDIMMIPVGGVYTIGAKEANEVLRAVEPKITIPMHYQMDKLNKEVFSELSDVDAFLNETGLDSKREKKLTLKKGSILPDDQEIVVLDVK